MRSVELLLLIAHACIVIAFAVGAPRRQTDLQFSIGERRVGSFGLTASIFSTLVTESLIFFSVALTARFGPACAASVVAGPAAALIVLSVLAPRIHQEGLAHGAHCVSEYCMRAWGALGRLARIVLLLLLAWIVVLQVNLNGRLLSAILGWPLLPATAWAVILVGIYTLLGGYLTVVRTDIFQTFVLGAMVILPLFMSAQPDLVQAFSAPVPVVDAALVFGMSFTLTAIRPELWQRIYSASDGPSAARALRRASALFVIFGVEVLYYAVAVNQAVPNAGAIDAFVKGYRFILPYPLSAVFPVILVAAMMSSLDSAAFLFGVSATKESAYLARRHAASTRVLVAVALIGGGIASLAIFDSLAFAYKLDGIVAVFAVPLLCSYWFPLSRKAVGAAVCAGLTTYAFQIATGRIDRRPSEAFLSAVVAAVALAVAAGVTRPVRQPAT